MSRQVSRPYLLPLYNVLVSMFIRTLRCILRNIIASTKPTRTRKLAINDALPLKAARRDAIAKLKSF